MLRIENVSIFSLLLIFFVKNVQILYALNQLSVQCIYVLLTKLFTLACMLILMPYKRILRKCRIAVYTIAYYKSIYYGRKKNECTVTQLFEVLKSLQLSSFHSIHITKKITKQFHLKLSLSKTLVLSFSVNFRVLDFYC